MATPHPWRALRGMSHLFIHFRDDLPSDLEAITDGRRIWMADDLSQVQRRCALAHELVHLERGEVTCQPDEIEGRVNHLAARYLLPDIRAVADALAWGCGKAADAAGELWVTEEFLAARLNRRHLHPAELAIIRERLARADFSA